MTINMFQSSTVPLLQEVLNFTQSRHNVLAGNVANADTPGYQSRDLSPAVFQQKLKAAIQQRDARNTPGSGRSSSNNLMAGAAKSQSGDEMREVRDSIKDILYHDGTDVSLEHQVTELSKNQSTHNMAIALISSQFQLLQSAISERV